MRPELKQDRYQGGEIALADAELGLRERGRSGEKPYPDGYALLPKIVSATVMQGYSDEVEGADYDWVAMGRGIVDWLGQFRRSSGMVDRLAQVGDSLARGRHAGRIDAAEWGKPEAHTGKGWSALKCISHAAVGELRLQPRSR